ncbi:hypothetical protein SAY86_013407 [Trapa natans]|uniref:Uncharacterized protein n=1 Tax=Trapa natans TaxID=22666 RepID=A0AAN7MEE3_TRANT|nr:hypothetical protein SAY86_013407 [Trapa natans]
MSSSSQSSTFHTNSLLYSAPSDQLFHVYCHFCHTVLVVSVPCSSLFKTVTVRCGHCTNLLSVNMRALLLPIPASHQFQEEIRNNTPANMMISPPMRKESMMQLPGGIQDNPKSPPVKRPPEKRQRVPSAYNCFIKDEIQRIKAGNPDISHREAFSAAAKNWAHFPHIHFGLMSDPPVKKPNNISQQDGEDRMLNMGFIPPTTNVAI